MQLLQLRKFYIYVTHLLIKIIISYFHTLKDLYGEVSGKANNTKEILIKIKHIIIDEI